MAEHHTQAPALARCPFCGGKAKISRESLDERYAYANVVKVQCSACGVSVSATGDTSKPGYADNSTTEARASAKWNRRSIPQGDEPAWESTTPVYVRFISDARYQRLRPAFQKWYRPICKKCGPDAAAQGDELPPLPEYDMLAAYNKWLEKRGPLGVGAMPERVFFAGWLAACRAGRAKGEEPKWGAVHTVGDMVRNLLTLDQAAPIFTAFHLSVSGERRCKVNGVMISRERVVDGTWIDSSRKDSPYAHVIWAKPDEGTCTEAKGEDARDAVTEPKSCWSCGRMYTEDQRLDADGDCPHCGVEIEAAATAPEGKGENG